MSGAQVAVAVFAIVAGLAMLGAWTVLLTTRQVPEVRDGDRDIWFHVAAEAVTGVTLVVGGVALFASDALVWARLVAGAGLGALTYSCIASSGYYVKQGKSGPVTMFAVLGALGVACLIVLAR